jgi:hypothetical protein
MKVTLKQIIGVVLVTLPLWPLCWWLAFGGEITDGMMQQLGTLGTTLIVLSPLLVIVGLGIAVRPDRWDRIRAGADLFWAGVGGVVKVVLAATVIAVVLVGGYYLVDVAFAAAATISIRGLLGIIVVLLAVLVFSRK